MGLSMKGIDELILELRHKAERVADSARKTMHRGADKIVEEARLNAPVDTETLEDAIHKEVSYGGRGRLQIDIKISGETNPKSGADVEAYALRVHEDYENIPGAPGKKTIEKREAHPERYVGEKFLERALEDQAPKLEAALIAATAKEVSS